MNTCLNIDVGSNNLTLLNRDLKYLLKVRNYLCEHGYHGFYLKSCDFLIQKKKAELKQILIGLELM